MLIKPFGLKPLQWSKLIFSVSLLAKQKKSEKVLHWRHFRLAHDSLRFSRSIQFPETELNETKRPLLINTKMTATTRRLWSKVQYMHIAHARGKYQFQDIQTFSPGQVSTICKWTSAFPHSCLSPSTEKIFSALHVTALLKGQSKKT